MSFPKLLTVDEVASVLRTTRKQVYNMAERGQLPGALKIGRRLLIREHDLLRLVDGHGASHLESVR